VYFAAHITDRKNDKHSGIMKCILELAFHFLKCPKSFKILKIKKIKIPVILAG
jgi:hypothetical protein